MSLEHGLEICHRFGYCHGITHHLHGESGLVDKRVEWQNGEHRIQHSGGTNAWQVYQPFGVGRSGKVGIRQHDFIAMAHGGQDVQ